ncbi:MAG: COX15/CtaA family protein [Myxococcota bacterium]
MVDRLYRWAAFLVAATYGLLVFGASVRVHGAGLACPDWPLCFGDVVPAIDFEVGLEFGHRVLAGIVSLGFLAIGGTVIANRRRFGRGPVVLVGIAAVALAVQIVLGGLTVLHLLAEWTVASHLLAGNTFCLLLLLLTLSLRDAVVPGAAIREPVSLGQRAAALALALLVPTQLAVGGLVSSSFAGLACGTWPTCDGVSWFPTWSGPVGLQLVHRSVAYAIVGAAAFGLLVARHGRAGRAAMLVAVAVAVQATIGILNVWWRLPVEVTLAHTAGAAAVVLSTTWLNHEVWRAPLGSAHGVGSIGVSAVDGSKGAPMVEAR